MRLIIILMLCSSACFAQFSSSSSVKICDDVPKANSIGDTVSVNNCGHTSAYVLKKITKKGIYKYKELVEGEKSYIFIQYDSLSRVHSYEYKYKSWGLFGSSGKGFVQVEYYRNGNIRNSLTVDYYSGLGQFRNYSSVDFKVTDRSLVKKNFYYVLKKGKKLYFTKNRAYKRKDIQNLAKLRKSNLKLSNQVDFEVYYIEGDTEDPASQLLNNKD